MFTANIEYFRRKPMNVHKITVMVDHGYHPEKIMAKLEQIYPQIGKKIRIERSAKLSKQEKKEMGKSGFVPVKTRWVIERSNSWMERCKSLAKNYEKTLFNSTQKINLCFMRLMIKRLAIS